jgi:erythromycin esterase-like protein
VHDGYATVMGSRFRGSVATRDVEAIRRVAVPAPDGVPPYEALDELIGDARTVLIGESTHGTREFYAARAQITRWLIAERGFCGVAAEADWPDAYRVNRYVRGYGADGNAEQALRGFQRFPSWMWRNTEVRDFVEWLRNRNEDKPFGEGAGFYGLDLYSLQRSIEEVVAYLDRVDPAAAARARQRYGCFDHAADDSGQAYGRATAFGAGKQCEAEAVEQLVDMQRHALEYARRDGLLEEDEAFYAEQNAATVRNAEQYYRAMFGGRTDTWNLRDRHMAQTLRALQNHLDRHDPTHRSRIVVWAHNSHVGDARATEMSEEGQLTLGQLAREANNCVLIGLSTHSGTVTAASSWGGVAQRKAVRPALSGSIEALMNHCGDGFFVRTHDDPGAKRVFDDERLTRAIGVIYLPATERRSHYFQARAARQYDAVIHIGRTAALEPLEPSSRWTAGEVPESYPSGL